MADRRALKDGHVLVTIDFRNHDANTGNGVEPKEFLALLGAMIEVLRPESLFFDFGLVNLREVNVSAVTERIRESIR